MGSSHDSLNLNLDDLRIKNFPAKLLGMFCFDTLGKGCVQTNFKLF